MGGEMPPPTEERASPHETVNATVGSAEITITYGRPYKKGRVIFGGLEPWGAVWRTGADEATTFTSTQELVFGDLIVPVGTYGLFTLPTEDGWTLIFNKVADQWGAFDYDENQDLGRTPMKVEMLDAPVEQLTLAVEPTGENTGTLSVTWDTTHASADFVVQ